jgi:hypothetical protein
MGARPAGWGYAPVSRDVLVTVSTRPSRPPTAIRLPILDGSIYVATNWFCARRLLLHVVEQLQIFYHIETYKQGVVGPIV